MRRTSAGKLMLKLQLLTCLNTDLAAQTTNTILQMFHVKKAVTAFIKTKTALVQALLGLTFGITLSFCSWLTTEQNKYNQIKALLTPLVIIARGV